MKTISVSAELAIIQRSVEAAALLVEVGRQGGVGNEDVEALASAVLALTACRLRDLGRAVRGTLAPELFVAAHNEAVAGADSDDVLLGTQRHVRRKRKV